MFTYLAEAAYELMKQPKNVPSHGTEMDSQRVCDAEATMSEGPGSNVALVQNTSQTRNRDLTSMVCADQSNRSAWWSNKATHWGQKGMLLIA